MKILQIVTLVTPDGAFGGPLRVALNQARTLREAGHEVTLLAGYHGYDGDPPSEVDGEPVRLFTVSTFGGRFGFAGHSSLAMRRWLRRNAREYDVAHIHLARDMVTLPAARLVHRAGIPYILQTHGMVDQSSKKLARLVDVVMTRPALAAASNVLYLTDRERSELLIVGARPSSLRALINGVPPADAGPSEARGTNVLFLARLQQRKRPLAFVELAAALTDIPDCTFSIVGPDEGELDRVRARIDERSLANVIYEGSLPPARTVSRMMRADIFVLPSVDEPFPMAVLEALSVGLPVVVTRSCGLAEYIEMAGCGLVVDETQSSLNAAVRRLVEDEAFRVGCSVSARKLAAERFSMQYVLRELEITYAQACEPAGAGMSAEGAQRGR